LHQKWRCFVQPPRMTYLSIFLHDISRCVIMSYPLKINDLLWLVSCLLDTLKYSSLMNLVFPTKVYSCMKFDEMNWL
jgi:hypothetical protein